MKRISVLVFLGLLVVLAGGFCETSGNPDAKTAAPQMGSSRGTGEESSGQGEMKALALAYPDRIAEVALRGDDWALRIDDTWYFWAQGRLLPDELRYRWEEYASYRFYFYPLGLPPIPDLDEEAKRSLKERLERSAVNPSKRHQGFIWGGKWFFFDTMHFEYRPEILILAEEAASP